MQMNVERMQPGHSEQLRTFVQRAYYTCMSLLHMMSIVDVSDLVYSGRSGAAGQFKGDVSEWVALVQSCVPDLCHVGLDMPACL